MRRMHDGSEYDITALNVHRPYDDARLFYRGWFGRVLDCCSLAAERPDHLTVGDVSATLGRATPLNFSERLPSAA